MLSLLHEFLNRPNYCHSEQITVILSKHDDADLDFTYRDPEAGFDKARVKGVVAKLVHINDVQHATALEVAAGGKLYQVIVDTEATAKALLAKGSLRQRVTIIPINKVRNWCSYQQRKTLISRLLSKPARLNKSFCDVDIDILCLLTYGSEPCINTYFHQWLECKLCLQLLILKPWVLSDEWRTDLIKSLNCFEIASPWKRHAASQPRQGRVVRCITIRSATVSWHWTVISRPATCVMNPVKTNRIDIVKDLLRVVTEALLTFRCAGKGQSASC